MASPENTIILFVGPPKFCISIVFVFSWDHCKSQEKLETMLMQNLGEQRKSIMVFSRVVYSNGPNIVNRGEWLARAARLFHYVIVHLFGLSHENYRAQHQHGIVQVLVDKQGVLTKNLLIMVYLTTKTIKTYSRTCLEITVPCLAALLALEPRELGYGSFLPHETRNKDWHNELTKYRVADKVFQRRSETTKSLLYLIF